MKVLFLGPSENQRDVQTNLGDPFVVQHAITDNDVDKVLPDIDFILDAYMKIRFPRARLQNAKNLKMVVCATTGSDHIDSGYLASRNIQLLSLKGQKEILRNLTPAAEHSWLLLMASARLLPGAIREVEKGRWDRNNVPGIMLRGKIIGIVGCGRIGQWMATYASAFGMKCLGYDPLLNTWPTHIEGVSLELLLSSSDFVSIHVPLEEGTKKLLGRKQFKMMKKGVVVVNTSRGEVIDEETLLDGLKSGHVAAAGLDVLTGEPNINNHPLVQYSRTHNNLVITPHIGGFSPEALKHVLRFSCQRILDFVTKKQDGNKSGITY